MPPTCRYIALNLPCDIIYLFIVLTTVCQSRQKMALLSDHYWQLANVLYRSGEQSSMTELTVQARHQVSSVATDNVAPTMPTGAAWPHCSSYNLTVHLTTLSDTTPFGFRNNFNVAAPVKLLCLWTGGKIFLLHWHPTLSQV